MIDLDAPCDCGKGVYCPLNMSIKNSEVIDLTSRLSASINVMGHERPVDLSRIQLYPSMGGFSLNLRNIHNNEVATLTMNRETLIELEKVIHTQLDAARPKPEVSPELKEFFGVEIRNERAGGISPATVGSACDSWRQAPDDICLEYCGLPADSHEIGRLTQELFMLLSTCGEDLPLSTLVE